MKKGIKYSNPIVQVISIDSDDVIITSCAGTDVCSLNVECLEDGENQQE